MDYLSLFSAHNLALLSDWHGETGELYVDMYWPHSGSSGIGFFIRSMKDLKSLLSKDDRHEVSIMIFRRLQFPLRGIADENLLARALEQIPDNQPFEILSLEYYPEHSDSCGDGGSHEDLRRELTEVFGEFVAIGQLPDVYSGKIRPNSPEVFEIIVSHLNQFQPVKNQDFYEPYAKEPQRYRWIEELWREQ